MRSDGAKADGYAGLSVAILTEADPSSASTRYRALQYVPRLRTLFERVEVSPAGDTVVRHPGRLGQVGYFSSHAVRYVERGLGIRDIISGHDGLMVQRGLYPVGPGLIVDAVRRYEGRVVLDLDDAVFELRPSLASKGRLARWLYGPQQTLRLLARADEIVVSTAALAEMLPTVRQGPTILPTVPDPAGYPIVEQVDRLPVVVGWAGNIGGLGYLDPLAPVFERLARAGLARLEVVCSHPWSGPASFRPWCLAEETSLFADFAIGIMPLPDTPYTRAKAGFKLLQYMAAGLPVVASPVGVNSEFVNRSGAGYLASTTTEWESALRELARDADLRSRLGGRGRAFVERFADLDGHAATVARLLAGSPPTSQRRDAPSALVVK